MSLGTPPIAAGAAADAARADGAVADRAAAAAPAPGGGGYHIHTARRVRTPMEEKKTHTTYTTTIRGEEASTLLSQLFFRACVELH